MQLRYTREQRALAAELRAYFDTLMTPERREALESLDDESDGSAYREIVRQLGKDGWLVLGWPTGYGGQGRSQLDQLIFLDEAALAGVPIPFLTLNTVGPTIMRHGTEEQKREYLPRIAGGELHFAIGYSEPGAGTDLASLRTKAVRDGDDYVVNGQKMWTSLVGYADYVWLACRTDPEAVRHRGLSVLVVPTDAKGFSWTPVRTMAGITTSATYYQDVRVPVEARIGGENEGWALITNQLNHERIALTSAAPLRRALADVRAWAAATPGRNGKRLLDSEWVQTHLARVHAHAEVLRLMNLRAAWEKDLTAAAASATKVYGTELSTEAYRLLMEVLGPSATLRTGSPGAAIHGRIERAHRAALILTFGGGTNEIQRDIIAAGGLRLPVGRR
ncbi:acyl-CoA dehydrogenase family protein [Cryptosporangium sp. NPDC051539]|uniref:acyl-CoA dehydrogenase family protein n=1 Tax=Cryptosporangium sp. NPDC051539 TaxID=3363962 RepID=UPI0037AF228E